MNKNILRYFKIVFILLVFIFSTSIQSEEIRIQHTVDKISHFNIKSTNINKFEDDNAVNIAEVSIRNNTRDGYKVTLQTTYGVLRPTTSSDGETDIPYQFSKNGSGTLPEETADFIRLQVPSSPPTSETIILGAQNTLTGDSLLSVPTDYTFNLQVNLTNTDFIDMAGDYSDTVIITYTDL